MFKMDSNPSLKTLQMDCLSCSPSPSFFVDFTLEQNVPLTNHPFIHTEHAHVQVMVVAGWEGNLLKHQTKIVRSSATVMSEELKIKEFARSVVKDAKMAEVGRCDKEKARQLQIQRTHGNVDIDLLVILKNIFLFQYLCV